MFWRRGGLGGVRKAADCGFLPYNSRDGLLNAYLGPSDRGKNGNFLVHKEDFEFSIVI
jgi:hypothetical protein